jgi:hypothetical protein
MTIYDLLFLFLVLVSAIVLLTVGVKAIRGRGKSALLLLGVWAACMAVYFGICVATAAAEDQKVLPLGEPQCFDDWCIQVDGVNRSPAANATEYVATIRISSRARRVTQREKDVTVLLQDATGNRYAAAAAANEPPFDVQLGPGESVTTHREFQLPAGSQPAGMVIAHTGFQMGWLVIGEGQGMFHKEPIVRLQ